MDPRYVDLAENLVGYSVKAKRGEAVLIDAFDIPDAMVIALIRAVRKRGAEPHVNVHHERVRREFIKNATESQLKALNAAMLAQMKAMDCYIALRGSYNIFETSDIHTKQQEAYFRATKPTLDWRVNKTRWVITRWPNPSMAQLSKMSTEQFEDFYFDVTTMDYGRMQAGAKALKKLMDNTDRVEIKGKGVHLQFSIKDIPAVMCIGGFNIPDGEVFSAPVKNSVEGYIEYNCSSVYQGCSFEKVRFEFEKGKIVKATSNDTKRLNAILDSDKGARYIGEFAIGFHPHIKEPMQDILFDEKIAGSFHFTPGQAYEDADNGNRSAVHWDLVSIQRKSYGGGEIYFDGKLIRKDGLFVPKSLQKLNPDYLLEK